MLLLYLPHSRHVLVVDEVQPGAVHKLPHGVQKTFDEGTGLLHSPGFPAAVLG